MTLQDFSKSQLEGMRRVAANKALKELLESRVSDIKEDDFSVPIKDVDGMIKREFNRGMVQAYEAILSLPDSLDEELELRHKEKELADSKK